MISGIFTVLALLAFLGITAWAYARHNRARFEEAARLPLDESDGAAAAQETPVPACCKEPA